MVRALGDASTTPGYARIVGSTGPFFKAVGGKRQLLPELLKHVPAKVGRYFEPFVGGGALFFDLAGRLGAGSFKSAHLNDRNPDLIAAYLAVRDQLPRLISTLQMHADLYARDGEQYYYAVRAQSFSPDRQQTAAAARFLFLNRTCFNGLYRVNKAGKFNVPHGKYKNPTICNEDVLRKAHDALQGVEIEKADFTYIAARAAIRPRKGDFFYFDPPYFPRSDTADFTSYTKDGFTGADQESLMETALSLKRLGATVLLSNSDTPMTRKLYKNGFEMRKVQARRNVNSVVSKRGAVSELLIW